MLPPTHALIDQLCQVQPHTSEKNIFLSNMDLSDDDDFDVSVSNSYQPSKSSSLIQTKAQAQNERFKQQQNYDIKARNQRQERKRLMREVFNRRREDFPSQAAFEKYDEERELIVWSKVKGFDIWQYNTSTNEDVWLDLPVVDMKLLSKSKSRKSSSSGAVKQTLTGGKIAHLGTMSWRSEDSTNGKLRFLSTQDRIAEEIRLHKDIIQKNKNRLLEEEREIEAEIADEIFHMEKQIEGFQKRDRDEHNNLRRMNTAVDDADINKRRRHDVYLSSAFEREKRELFDSLKVFPSRMKDVKDDTEGSGMVVSLLA